MEDYINKELEGPTPWILLDTVWRYKCRDAVVCCQAAVRGTVHAAAAPRGLTDTDELLVGMGSG